MGERVLLILTRRLVLDVLKPLNPPIHELASRLCQLDGVAWVECSVLELDRETETIKVTLNGSNIPLRAVEAAIGEFGAALHSVDSVMVQRQFRPVKRAAGRPSGKGGGGVGGV